MGGYTDEDSIRGVSDVWGRPSPVGAIGQPSVLHLPSLWRTVQPQNEREAQMRTVTVEVKVRLTIKADEDANITEVVNDLEVGELCKRGENADIEDAEVIGHEVTDSR